MPELPDVETFRERLDRSALHRRIEQVTVTAPGLLGGRSVEGFRRQLRGRTVAHALRHGKYVLAELDDGSCLAFHFGLTGALEPFESEPPPYTYLIFRMDRGNLSYVSRRKLGRVQMHESVAAFEQAHTLGPDALDDALTFERFAELASRRPQAATKCWLMDQSSIAGIGNVYSDEILFQSGIHPKRPVGSLAEKQLKRLYREMRRVLTTATARHADPATFPNSWITPLRGRPGPCPRQCGGQLTRLAACGRSAWYCPVCQPMG